MRTRVTLPARDKVEGGAARARDEGEDTAALAGDEDEGKAGRRRGRGGRHGRAVAWQIRFSSSI
jgi:hypothetical protein